VTWRTRPQGGGERDSVEHFASAETVVSAASRLGCPVHHEAGAGQGLKSRRWCGRIEACAHAARPRKVRIASSPAEQRPRNSASDGGLPTGARTLVEPEQLDMTEQKGPATARPASQKIQLLGCDSRSERSNR